VKKGLPIGVGVIVVVMIIILGINAIPDEVVMENPIETSNQPTEPILLDVEISEDMSAIDVSENIPIETEPEESQVVSPQEPEETQVPTPEEPEEIPTNEAASEGRIIEVKVSDGVGSGDR